MPGARPLSAGLGDLRPEVLSSLERAALDWAGGSVQRLEDAFDEAFGALPCDDDVLGSDVPPEVVPLVSSGLDGPHFGFLVMAPEIDRIDAPVVSFGPGRPVRPFAASTRAAFARLAELEAEHNDELDDRLVDDLAAALELPAASAPPEAFVASIPVGYRWRRGRDGIGVLAAAAAFGPTVIPDQPGLSLAEIDQWASRLLYDGFPAAACAVVRDAFTVGHGQPATWNRLARTWAASYEALNRPGLADQVRRRTARFG